MSQAINSIGASTASFETQRLATVLSLQKNAVNQQGEQTLKLIQSAAVLPNGQGNILDVVA